MSHDKYNSSHQILVGKDPELLTAADDNLKLKAAGDIELSTDSDIIISSTDFSVTSGGNLNIAGDLSVTGTINGSLDPSAISGSITVTSLTATTIVSTNITTDNLTADDLSFSDSTTRILKWVPGSSLQAAALQTSYPTSGTDTIGSVNGFGGAVDYPTLLVGHSTDPTWEIYFPLDPYVPNGATIKEILFVIENFTSGKSTGGFDYQATIEEAVILGTDDFSAVESATNLAGPNATGTRSIINFEFSGVTVNTGDGVGSSKFYRVKFEQIDTDENTILIGKMGIIYEVSSLSQALGVLS